MKPLSLWISACVLVLLASWQSTADQPLAPPKNFRHKHEMGVVIGKVAQKITIIRPAGTRWKDRWTIPTYVRNYRLGPEGRSLLALQPEGNLISHRMGQLLAATVWYQEDRVVLSKILTLEELIDPMKMPQTVSHYALYDGIEQTEGGWLMHMSDGTKSHISAP